MEKEIVPIKFSKNIKGLIFWIVALLGLSAIFQEEIKIGLEVILSLAAIILFIGLTYLILIKITEFERLINKIEQKFIREKDLNKIRTDIKSIKLTLNKK
ncbi:hypothetical protein HOD75_02210 [archaeon]|jgi:hypothetical protein|nr:hypothetical protein [archaeon]MBT4241691.1 hypothetical protein [archaeon]MBT4418239.1 hypothetical protein [archaeon]